MTWQEPSGGHDEAGYVGLGDNEAGTVRRGYEAGRKAGRRGGSRQVVGKNGLSLQAGRRGWSRQEVAGEAGEKGAKGEPESSVAANPPPEAADEAASGHRLAGSGTRIMLSKRGGARRGIKDSPKNVPGPA